MSKPTVAIDIDDVLADSIEHCKSAAEYNVSPILFGDYGWHTEDVVNDVVRCHDWLAVLEYFNGRG